MARKRKEPRPLPFMWLAGSCLLLIAISSYLSGLFPVKYYQSDSSLDEPPLLEMVEREPFVIEKYGKRFDIEPVADFDIHAVVVSKNSFQFSTIKNYLWEDHINIADFCVVWGDNARRFDLNSYGFENFDWFCKIDPGTPDFGEFDWKKLTNTHLLSEDPYVREQLLKVRPGDKIHLSGMLANYSHARDNGSRGGRNTSTVLGDSKCETVYVQYVSIDHRANPFWYFLNKAGWFALLLVVVMWIRYEIRHNPVEVKHTEFTIVR